MEKLEKAYEAIALLETLGLPVSKEQEASIADMEKEYLLNEVIPLIEQELAPLVENLKNNFQIELAFDKETGLAINMVSKSQQVEDLFGASGNQVSRRTKKYIIRVTFPDNTVSCKRMVWETLMDVIAFAGAKKVQQLGIVIMGINLVSSELHENERYRVGQKEIEPGLYVCTYSSTETKLDQIKFINRQLNLGLKIEKVLLQ